MEPAVIATYQGRKTSRHSSEQRRLAILNAALRVLVRDGVRGVRHRAVAKEADVPLSATTYYFKDIHDLLADAFAYFINETMQVFVEPFWARANEWIQTYPRDSRSNPLLVSEISHHMAAMGADYILTRVSQHKEQLVVEHAFWYAALGDERLHSMALQHSLRLLSNFTRILDFVGVSDVELGAKSILTTVRRLEYEGMIAAPDFSKESIEAALAHQIRMVLLA